MDDTVERWVTKKEKHVFVMFNKSRIIVPRHYVFRVYIYDRLLTLVL